MLLVSIVLYNQANFSCPVDCTEAGEGQLLVDVSCKGRKVESLIRQTAEGQYDVEFTPKESAAHNVEITWNNELVNGKKTVIYKYIVLYPLVL